ncbi:cytochrome ubiquinol oxidase subunit I [Fimbriimonas ginsengisoli]|uniref:Cytochrome bd ubiquinol oxidase, subunit I n=1 Tax=Fimbriimonas ginsengisoli Gsoil 348 TaxID=661478 RepID=A0A068NV18_FIMGI|nr:cytochrome ubiquinol oxidase subunit I [Fimbriimonas ginsengisoli]AIE86585.1 cytochrome bd ubiquinol oxidase, subunit I [Fimbriimonas ginsengisoli Gsoil 348]
MNAVIWSRIQFGFLITYHYLFPQLTMGLALIIFVLKLIAYRKNDERYDRAAQFWARIFGLNFVVGVVTGIPMEFQFGTNWAKFSNYAGGVIGLTLALEGMFAFFAESSFLGLFLFGAKKLGPKGHLFASFMVFAGSWLSGYFIVATNAFMQHPVGYSVGRNGALQLSDLWGYLFNPWAIWQYLHTMTAAAVTGSFVVAAVGAYYLLSDRHQDQAKLFVKVGVITGLIASVLILFPTGDMHGKMMARHQPAALAAMEGKFETGDKAEIAIIGQPDVANRRLNNPVQVPYVLSYLAYGSFGAQVKGMNDFPKEDLPDNIELLYFAYHIMAGLGTMQIALMLLAGFMLFKHRLYKNRVLLWVLMLAFPFPYIATTMGWMTAELGRQPWLIYGLQRTIHGHSPTVSGGEVAFSTLGFVGLYAVLGVLFLYLVSKQLAKGPGDGDTNAYGETGAA